MGAPTAGGLGNSLSFGGVTLPAKDGIRSLGIHLDPALTMESQVTSVVHTAFFHLRRIAQLRSYLDVEALTTLVHALIISRLDHCNALYVGLPLRLLRKLQMVQNAAARVGEMCWYFFTPLSNLAAAFCTTCNFRSSLKDSPT